MKCLYCNREIKTDESKKRHCGKRCYEKMLEKRRKKIDRQGNLFIQSEEDKKRGR